MDTETEINNLKTENTELKERMDKLEELVDYLLINTNHNRSYSVKNYNKQLKKYTKESYNEFTLIAGTYLIDARCPAYDVNDHKARLYNVSDSSTEVVGTNARADDHGDSVTDSCIKDIFTIASSKTFRIEHRCDSSESSSGFGLANGYGIDEIYTTVSLTKI